MKKHHSYVLRVLSLVGVLALVGPAPAQAQDPAAAERAAITKTAEAFVAAFQRGDANAVAAFWAADGDYVDIGGRVLKGRKAIADDYADLFAQNKGLVLRVEVGSIRFPTPDTAIEDGVTSVLSPDGALPNRAQYTNFPVKKDGKWLLASVRESAYEPPNNSEHLRPLEWLIGAWVEEIKDGHAARVVFEWTPDIRIVHLHEERPQSPAVCHGDGAGPECDRHDSQLRLCLERLSAAARRATRDMLRLETLIRPGL